jgi:hypothetical protein
MNYNNNKIIIIINYNNNIIQMRGGIIIRVCQMNCHRTDN